jgi:hypothetical protein
VIWVIAVAGVITGVGLIALVIAIVVKMPPSKGGIASGGDHDNWYSGGDGGAGDYGGGHHGGGH